MLKNIVTLAVTLQFTLTVLPARMKSWAFLLCAPPSNHKNPNMNATELLHFQWDNSICFIWTSSANLVIDQGWLLHSLTEKAVERSSAVSQTWSEVWFLSHIAQLLLEAAQMSFYREWKQLKQQTQIILKLLLTYFINKSIVEFSANFTKTFRLWLRILSVWEPLAAEKVKIWSSFLNKECWAPSVLGRSCVLLSSLLSHWLSHNPFLSVLETCSSPAAELLSISADSKVWTTSQL